MYIFVSGAPDAWQPCSFLFRGVCGELTATREVEFSILGGRSVLKQSSDLAS